MGGLAAVWGPSGKEALRKRVERMVARCPYRGPARYLSADDFAIAVQDLRDDSFLGEHEGVLFGLHGHVANLRDLIRGLEASDPGAALAQAFRRDGQSPLAEIRGHFAAVICDLEGATVLAARDLVGARPLFFHQSSDHGYLASEVRQIQTGAEIGTGLDEERLAERLLRRVPLTERTLHRRVRKVLPSRRYRFSLADPAREPEQDAYWQPPLPIQPEGTEDDFLTQLDGTLRAAIGRALPTEQFGIALSGGLDSAAIWTYAREEADLGGQPTPIGLTLSFPGLACDETGLVETLVEHTGGEAQFQPVDPEAFERLPDYAAATPGLFVHTLAFADDFSRLQAATGISSLLYGFGGDEWLTGGFRYLGDLLRSGRLLQLARDLRRLSYPPGTILRWLLPPSLDRWRARRGALPDWISPRFRHLDRVPVTGPHEPPPPPPSAAWADQLAYLHRLHASDDIENVELASASLGIDPIYPLMDRDLIELAFASSGRSFTLGKQPKGALRRVLGSRLTPSIVERRKMTFNALSLVVARLAAEETDPGKWALVDQEILAPEPLKSLRSAASLDQNAAAANRYLELYIAELLARHHGL